MTKRRKWIAKDRRPMVMVTGSHSKTIAFGVLSPDGKQLFRQYVSDSTAIPLLHTLRM